jgi:DNA-binding transcriptional MerR regulator/ubiquinone/menaquinone biosynthesis C-methylase UbiE
MYGSDDKMRIGKFGESNGISIDTIRHYMDLGLIVPEKRGGHYFFDVRCQKELEMILELKAMGFSLHEIKIIFQYRNFGKFTDYEEDAYYQSLFMDKFLKIEQEIKMLEEVKGKLKVKLDQLSEKSTANKGSMMGIDFRTLDMLSCIKCGNPLTLQDGIIRSNHILDGYLRCNCGEGYSIESGILIVGKPYKSSGGPTLEENIFEYIHATEEIYLDHLDKGLHWSKRKLDQVNLQQKVLLELGTGVGFFLRTIYQDLPEDCLYIAVDHNLERQQFLKRTLERSGSKRKVLFICADFLEMPLRKHSVDILIDHSGTSNYSFEHEEFLLREVDELLKPGGFLLSSFIAFKNFSPKSKVDKKYRDNFTVQQIKKNLKGLGYLPLDERNSEPINKGGRYENFFVEGEEIFSYSFYGKR